MTAPLPTWDAAVSAWDEIEPSRMELTGRSEVAGVDRAWAGLVVSAIRTIRVNTATTDTDLPREVIDLLALKPERVDTLWAIRLSMGRHVRRSTLQAVYVALEAWGYV